MIKLGKKAPAFALKDKDGEKYRLADFDADYTVLFFYPKDNTPGCTIEAQSFSKNLKKFDERGVAVVGISGGDADSKEKFCSKHGLKVLLLSDPEFKVSDKYGVYGEKKFMGKRFMGISRATYLLDEDKRVIEVFDKVKPITHVKELLDYIDELEEEYEDDE